ncbi:GIY-YIG nuclease family protein [Patescibacteria group bacterium]|nr:GIY-YIG nuclease family protein [Patescibacteria group bacterium]
MMKPWKWFVYIIECLDGFYYTGLTWNPDERMEQHKSGQGSKFTGKHGFKKLVYLEEFSDLIEARNREKQIKDFSRKKKELLFKSE